MLTQIDGQRSEDEIHLPKSHHDGNVDFFPWDNHPSLKVTLPKFNIAPEKLPSQ